MKKHSTFNIGDRDRLRCASETVPVERRLLGRDALAATGTVALPKVLK